MNEHEIVDEYISRNALIRAIEPDLEVASNPMSGNVYLAMGLRSALNDIKRQKAADVEPIDRWVDAQKNPPPIVDRRSMTSESVLILRDNGRCAVAYYCYDAEDGYYWTTDDEKTMYAWEEVTHWQPLPEPPKDDDVNG